VRPPTPSSDSSLPLTDKLFHSLPTQSVATIKSFLFRPLYGHFHLLPYSESLTHLRNFFPIFVCQVTIFSFQCHPWSVPLGVPHAFLIFFLTGVSPPSLKGCHSIFFFCFLISSVPLHTQKIHKASSLLSKDVGSGVPHEVSTHPPSSPLNILYNCAVCVVLCPSPPGTVFSNMIPLFSSRNLY